MDAFLPIGAYAGSFALTIVVLALTGRWLDARNRAEAAEHDRPTNDFGATEGDDRNFVVGRLN